MIVANCQHEATQKFGKDRAGNQRHKCKLCGATVTQKPADLLAGVRVPEDKAIMALTLILEGNSLRSTSRVTGLTKNTIGKLILRIGNRCQRLLLERTKGAKIEAVQLDEIWGFVGCKQKVANKKRTQFSFDEDERQIGDVYTFIAIEATSKLVLAHVVGRRDSTSARKVLSRLDWVAPERFQLTTDGYPEYTRGVRREIGNRIDYAQLVKIYGHTSRRGIPGTPDTRYSPAVITAIKVYPMLGNPDRSKINTSYIERFNLDVRMRCRRMTRLSNGFSKSWKHHEAAIALLLAWHNFVRIHGTIKTTPAVAAGLVEKPWTVRDLLTELAKQVA